MTGTVCGGRTRGLLEAFGTNCLVQAAEFASL